MIYHMGTGPKKRPDWFGLQWGGQCLSVGGRVRTGRRFTVLSLHSGHPLGGNLTTAAPPAFMSGPRHGFSNGGVVGGFYGGMVGPPISREGAKGGWAVRLLVGGDLRQGWANRLKISSGPLRKRTSVFA